MRKILRFLKRKGYVINIVVLLMLLENVALAAIDVQMYMMYESLIIRVLIAILGMIIITYIMYLVSVELENYKHNRIQQKQVKKIRKLNKENETKLKKNKENDKNLIEDQDLKKLEDIGKINKEVLFDTIDFDYRLVNSKKINQLENKNDSNEYLNISKLSIEEVKNYYNSLESKETLNTVFLPISDNGINTEISEIKDVIYLEKSKKQKIKDIEFIKKLNDFQLLTQNKFNNSKVYFDKNKEIKNAQLLLEQQANDLLNMPKKRGRKKVVQLSSMYSNDELKNAVFQINSKEIVEEANLNSNEDFKLLSNIILNSKENENIEKSKVFKKENKIIMKELFDLQKNIFENIISVNEELSEKSKDSLELKKEKEFIKLDSLIENVVSENNNTKINESEKVAEFEFKIGENKKLKIFETSNLIKEKKAPSKYKYDLFTMIDTISKQEIIQENEKLKKELQLKLELERKQKQKKMLELQIIKLKLEQQLNIKNSENNSQIKKKIVLSEMI